MDFFTGEILAMIAVTGIMAGVLSGLLGVGGGIILVPGLYALFTAAGYAPDDLMHLCVGTSLAIIVPTGMTSAYHHWRRGGVDRDALFAIGPYLIAGVVAGSIAITRISGESLTVFFAAMLLVIAILMQVDPQKIQRRDALPGQPEPGIAGAVIGFVSTLMGIGGASLNVPYMAMNGIPIHRAVGTASCMGPVIALPAIAGFVLAGWHAAHLPPYSLGYVNLAAFAVVVPLSVLCAPLGVALAHRFSRTTLRRCFALFMVIVALKMGYAALT